MIDTGAMKILNLTPPAAEVNNGSLTIATIDTKGWQYLDVYVLFGAMTAVPTVLKLTQSDLSGSGFTDLIGSRYGTDTTTTFPPTVVPLPTTANANGVVGWHVSLNGKKRYVLPVLTISNAAPGLYATVIAVLSRPGGTPNTATLRGMLAELTIE